MINEQDIRKLLKEGVHLTLEMKKCKDSVPESVWETVSAFANTRGGIILLGIVEQKDRPFPERFEIAGVEDADKVVTDFFNMLNNPQKINRSVLIDSDVRIVKVDGKDVIYINVPEADYRKKPIFINQKPEQGTYKRGYEGNRRVNHEELALLQRDSSNDVDLQIFEYYGLEDIDAETLRKYRQAFNTENPGHAYVELSDLEFLIKMGGYDINRKNGTEGLTMAGLLMFGQGLHIHKNFPNFRVDYLDLIDIAPGEGKKWNDRLTDDGRWEDNLYNFLILTLRKLLFTLPSEGKPEGVIRRDGGVMHEAVREAVINAITYCDYLLGGVLRIDRRTDRIVVRNPGTLRIPPARIYNGDYTQARNSTIRKMLRMAGFGDNIGSGFQKMMKAWRSLGYASPEIHEEEDVNEVWLTLPLNFEEAINDRVNDVRASSEGHRQGKEKGTKRGIKKGVKKNRKGKEKGTENLFALIPQEIISELSELQQNILLLIWESPRVTLQTLSNKLNISVKALRVQREKLKDMGIVITREGAQKNGEWVLSYQS